MIAKQTLTNIPEAFDSRSEELFSSVSFSASVSPEGCVCLLSQPCRDVCKYREHKTNLLKFDSSSLIKSCLVRRILEVRK